MKAIAILVLATLSLAIAPATQARDNGYRSAAYCAPRLICTKEVCRRTECRWATDHCGRRYSYEVTVITYANHYSDGSRNVFTRTFRA
jgi:hypothetical protein